MNVTLRFLDVFVMRYHITLKNFSGNGTNSFTVIVLIFFQKQFITYPFFPNEFFNYSESTWNLRFWKKISNFLKINVTIFPKKFFFLNSFGLWKINKYIQNEKKVPDYLLDNFFPPIS